jgi:hypothetical protein
MTFGILTIYNTSRDIKRQQKKSINLFQNQISTNTAFYLENTSDNVANFCFYIASVRKKRGYERKLLTVVLVVVVFFKFFEAGNERSF